MAKSNNNLKVGGYGEQKAVELLISKGFDIRERNYRYKRAEIDIIAQKDGLLLFVEVKTRSSIEYGLPEESIKSKKANLILLAAENYIINIGWSGDIRFDVISIELGKPPIITHIQDAFY